MSAPLIVGILNATPDSYYDGGTLRDLDAAMRRVEQMIAEGADVVEIGGESTGPHSKDVSVEEEMSRVLPIVERAHREFPNALLSVDTYKASVATAALDAGARMINDVTAGRADPRIFTSVADAGASLVLMYAKDATPRTTVADRQYDDVVRHIADFLRERKAAAVSAGVAATRIILDPGLGHFVSSDARYSFEILARLGEFAVLQSPLLVSPSRKSFLAGPKQLPPADRLPATIAASAIAVLHGAAYIRTHDVADMRNACDVAAACLQTP